VIQQTRGHADSCDLVDCFLTPNHNGRSTLSQPSARISPMNQNSILTVVFRHLKRSGVV